MRLILSNFYDNSYQCSFEGFKKQGYSEKEAIKLMHKAVSLANDAISSQPSNSSTKDKGKSREKPSVVLALSCYGAILSPGQEYSGRYPPPFGHPAHAASFPSDKEGSSTSSSTIVQHQINRTQGDDSWLQEAERSLEDWHFKRLKVFASDAATWNKVSYVAFETLSVLYEGRAIRRAMTRLKSYIHEQRASEGKVLKWPRWWISFVFPDGSLPYTTSLETGDLSAQGIARAIFKEDTYKLTEGKAHFEVPLELPDGLGINCTKMRYLPELVKDFTIALKDMLPTAQEGKERTLVLYPDGGLVYDPVTKTWHQDGNSPTNIDNSDEDKSGSENAGEIWASQLAEIAQDALSSDSKAWNGAVLGGCCKASPAYIAALSERIC